MRRVSFPCGRFLCPGEYSGSVCSSSHGQEKWETGRASELGGLGFAGLLEMGFWGWDFLGSFKGFHRPCVELCLLCRVGIDRTLGCFKKYYDSLGLGDGDVM